MALPLLLATPWLALLAFLLLRVRPPREVPPGPPRGTPLVSVIVPARNESVNIRRVITSLAASHYPRFEIIVVDDRSDDDTLAIARSMSPGNARRLAVVHGDELPEGWMGKPWACTQGARVAQGDLLLFTDADTVHGPDLLGRAVAAMEDDEADVLTLTGRQLMESFWERLVQPQIFFTMALRFNDPEGAARSGRWRDAIANGQFMIFTKEAYDALGGHQAVKDEVVEDLVLAQVVVRSGLRLSLRMAETCFATRMYRSLGDLVDGWSKNILTGGLVTMPPGLRPFVAPASGLSALTLWLAPPVALAAALAGVGGTGLLVWAGSTVGLSALLWVLFTWRMGAPAAYGLLYPLGAAVGMYIFARSWRRGRNVEWKGRAYVLKDVGEAP